jgi:acetyl esterase/lipase
VRTLVPLLVLIAACSTPTQADTQASSPATVPVATSSVTTAPVATTDSVAAAPVAPSTTTLPQPAEAVIYEHWRGSFIYGDGLRIDVHAPEVRSSHPVAVTVHGGGWYGGRLDSMGFLADGLAARGFVVFNATYRTLTHGGSFPGMVEDVACAVAYARANALDYSTTAHHFTLIGHSAGAHLSALVAFAPDTFGVECDGADVPVDAWVGLAGPYDTDAYAFLLQPFFGTAFADDPEPWRAGNPYSYVTSAPPGLDALIIHGEVDELIPLTMSENLYLALDEAGVRASLRVIADAGHGEVNSPRVVGDLIAELVAADQ